MAYITKRNSLRILKKFDFSSIKGLTGEVYLKPIYFLSPYEQNVLLGIRELFRNSEGFVNEYYVPIVNVDTYSYITEGGKPAYHNKPDCDRMQSGFTNFKIPEEIKERARKIGGENEVKKVVEEFRLWFKQNLYLLESNNLGTFIKLLEERWKILTKPEEVKFKNSGYELKLNLDLAGLENEIDNYLRKAGQYFRNNPDKQEMIRRFAKYTFLAYVDKEIYNNNTGFSDIQLKEFLKWYDIEFKMPVKNLLVEYYRVKFNPELVFAGKLLEQLGFKECFVCHEKEINEYEDGLDTFYNNSFESDDLVF